MIISEWLSAFNIFKASPWWKSWNEKWLKEHERAIRAEKKENSIFHVSKFHQKRKSFNPCATTHSEERNTHHWGVNIRIYFITSIKALQPHTNNSLYHHQAIIISCFSTLIAVFIRLLVFYHQAHTPPHHGNIQTHSSSLNIIFVLAIARDERKQSENEISTACHNIIALFSKYWFHHSTFFAKSITKFIVKALLESFFFDYSCIENPVRNL